MRTALLAMVVVSLLMASCSKPMAVAHTDSVRYFSRDYAAVPNDTYYAVRWALKENDLSVAEEDLPLRGRKGAHDRDSLHERPSPVLTVTNRRAPTAECRPVGSRSPTPSSIRRSGM